MPENTTNDKTEPRPRLINTAETCRVESVLPIPGPYPVKNSSTPRHTQAKFDVAESSTAAARAAVAAAREQLTTSLLLTANTTPAKHPRVKRAVAQTRNVMLALERTEIRAPVDGYVAQRRVQLGQRVQPGSSLMSVIPLRDVWVDANFKESQLADMRIGQSVELVTDIYGDDVVYEGSVQGLDAGTGAAFALLPAQNATGNWIKVVQRVPVRIQLDGKELVEHPLRIGLSLSPRRFMPTLPMVRACLASWALRCRKC